MTIREQEDQLIKELNALDDWFFQYEYLLQLSAELPCIEKSECDALHRVPGCQSGVWLWLERVEHDRLHIRIESDSLILKGILALYVLLFDGRSFAELRGFHSCLIEKTALKEQLSTDRFRGMQSVIKIIQTFVSENSVSSS